MPQARRPIQCHELDHKAKAKIHHEARAMYVRQRPRQMTNEQQVDGRQSQQRKCPSDPKN
jgi:hypothetical protein